MSRGSILVPASIIFSILVVALFPADASAAKLYALAAPKAPNIIAKTGVNTSSRPLIHPRSKKLSAIKNPAP